MWQIPALWKGGECWIIGGGNSITEQFSIPPDVVKGVQSQKRPISDYSPYLSGLHNKHVIAVNMAYRLGNWVDFVFFGDRGFWRDNETQLAAHPSIKVSCSESRALPKWIKSLRRARSKKYGLTVNEKYEICWNYNSGAAAINLAMYLGCKRIILIGFDMNTLNNKSHFHGAYKPRTAGTLQDNFNRHKKGFEFIAREAIEMGVEIINANPGSGLECFPKMTVMQALLLPEMEKETEQQLPVKVFYERDVNKKICIVTTFDINYLEAGKTLFNSIYRHTDCTGIDFKVITADEEVVKVLGAENCYFITEAIKERYKDVKYSGDLPAEKYASSWYRYEIFNMTEYDRVICIDSDCICVQDISYLFSSDLDPYDLISVEDHIVSKCFKKLVPELERQGLRLANLRARMAEGKVDIQPALLVINKRVISKEWYEKLLLYANTAPFSYSIDEGVLNDFIYFNDFKIKLLPIEWDYQDIYSMVCPELPVPEHPVIIHCQESKPFKKNKSQIDVRVHKYHDMWWKESKPIPVTLVVVLVWNRFENLQIWINAWKQCDKQGAELVVLHNLEKDNDKYRQLCEDNQIKYTPRENKGFDIGAFQDVCKERLEGFPNDWANLIWVTDDCIPMSRDFVGKFLHVADEGNLPCYEISNEVKRHIRTTGFLVTKDVSRQLTFPADPIETREHCYQFEHKSKDALYEQVVRMHKLPMVIDPDLKTSPLWDSGVRGYLNLAEKHRAVFTMNKFTEVNELFVPHNVLDDLAIKYKADKSSRYHNYAVKYDKLLSPFKDGFTSVLEIGVAQGQSVRMWADYFPNALIHGADIDPTSAVCEKYSDRIKFHLTDQRDAAQLKNLEQFAPFDLIIDDGNHWWMEQILTFQTLFPYVRKGGIYIVEDTTTSYWKEYKNHPVPPVEYFKSLVDEVNLKGAKGITPKNAPDEFGDWEKGWHRREDCYTDLPAFDSIQFLNGLIVIYKR